MTEDGERAGTGDKPLSEMEQDVVRLGEVVIAREKRAADIATQLRDEQTKTRDAEWLWDNNVILGQEEDGSWSVYRFHGWLLLGHGATRWEALRDACEAIEEEE